MARDQKKVRQGTVVSDQMDKSCVVLVERITQHPLYKRTVKSSKKYQIHDEENTCKSGDLVKLIECKPISKHKRWRLLEVVKRAV